MSLISNLRFTDFLVKN